MLGTGLFITALLVVLRVVLRVGIRGSSEKRRHADLGCMSQQWLAEYRASRSS
jgi:hypothetical protein